MKLFPVVVADDDPTTLKMLEGILTRAGYKVFTCADGEEAFSFVQRHKPVILLADCEMPGITGPKLCRMVRHSEFSSDVYAVLITANNRPEEIAAGLDEGADDYMAKPVHSAVLSARMRVGERVLILRTRQRQYAQDLESEIVKRTQTEGALRESEEKFKSISASAQDAIIMMDADGDISYWNEAAEVIFGYTRDEVLGKNLHVAGLIVPDRFHKAHRQAWPKFQEHGKGAAVGKTTEVIGLRKNGQEFPVEFSLSAVKIKERWHAIGMLRDITERKNAEAELRKLSVAVQQSPASIVITDTKGTIEYVNPKFTKVTGYTAEEAIGQNPRILKSGKWPKNAYEALWNRILAGETWTGEFENKKKNGELYWEAASICPIRDEVGSITHFLAVKQDISKQKEVEASLRKTESELRSHRDHLEEQVGRRTADLAKINDNLVHEVEERREAEKAAEAASSAKGDFLATMSHELRTPLNGIIGMTELLLGSGLTCEQKRQAGLVKASGDILLRLINDILDFSKIEAGKLELEITDFDLRDSVECVATLLGPQAEQKGLELTVGVNPAIPTTVRGDPGRLQQILTNLVSNAIKFTEEGQIVIRAVVDNENESSVSVRISVTDTGIGIPPDKKDLLFQGFSQLDASHSRRFGGTGLGLAISKQLVEMMGGEIGAISGTGTGSTFWFSVTLEKRRDTVTSLQIPSDFRHVRVLAVDDNTTNREILDEQLAGFGITHELVPDGEHALAALRKAAGAKDTFALAIIDLQMPNMDGEQLAQTIRSDPSICDTILLLLTSAGIIGDEERMNALGFSAWLPKPIRQSQLLDAITQALACARADTSHELDETTDSNQCSAQRPRTADANILAAEDNEIGQEVIRQVLSQAGYTHEIVTNGREAVDAWHNGDFDLVLMDCQMPEMDGFAATREIRRIEEEDAGNVSLEPRIPILALTANALKGDRERCLDAGMDDHVAKPFDPAQLIEAIESHLVITKKQEMTTLDSKSSDLHNDDLTSGSVDGGCADDTPSPFDMDTVLKRWGGDREFVQKLINKFLAAAPLELDQLAQFITSGDVAETTRLAHGLKGAAAYCGAEPFRKVAARLEEMGRANDLDRADECMEELKVEFEHCLGNARSTTAVDCGTAVSHD
jgi:two-component system, sensor histidine kinase and response regulator